MPASLLPRAWAISRTASEFESDAFVRINARCFRVSSRREASASMAGVNGGQNPTPDDGVDQKCETIPILQNCSVLVVDVIDGRYRVRRKEPEGRVQTHPT